MVYQVATEQPMVYQIAPAFQTNLPKESENLSTHTRLSPQSQYPDSQRLSRSPQTRSAFLSVLQLSYVIMYKVLVYYY